MPPATRDALEGQVCCSGSPGSVAIIPNTLWHAAGANRSPQDRIGVACSYQPWWIGRVTMDVYPVRREVWQRLPKEAQALTKHQLEWNVDFKGEVISG